MEISTPLTEEAVARLRAGDKVSITGTIYVGRDAAHKRLVAALDAGQPLPFDPQGQIIYYMGPAPAKPGEPIGSAGPTTSGRMDPYAPRLMEVGLKGMVGKGNRSAPVREAMRKYRAVYLGATGSLHLVWDVADTLNGLMALPNLVALLLLSHIGADTRLWVIVVCLTILGFGFALFSSPNMNAIMSSVEKRYYGVASGSVATMRLLGQMLSLGIVTLLFGLLIGRAQITPEHHPALILSARYALLIFFALCLGGIYFSFSRGQLRDAGQEAGSQPSDPY